MPLRLLAFSAAVFLVAASRVDADEPSADGDKPIKILLIGRDKDGHPHETHEYMPECHLLAKCLQQTPGVETRVSNGWPKDPEVARDVNAIVLYLPQGSNALFDGPHRNQVKQLLDKGVGLVAVHWATGAEKEEFGQLWLEHMGAWFNSSFSNLEHIERHQHQVDPKHPICRGWGDHDLFDEYYFDLRYAPEAKPLINVEHKDKQQTIAWTYERPGSNGGRSFGYVCGHYHKCFGNDSFRQTVVNGILWSAHREVPVGGAPCKIEPADLVLPMPKAEQAKP